MTKSTLYLLLSLLCKCIGLIMPLFIAVAYMTLIERKFIASIQRRKGPNVVGVFGLMQPFADALKLIFKETILPSAANRIVFILAPVLTLFLSLLGWAVIPSSIDSSFIDFNLGLLYVFAVSSLGVYGVIISGWSSNSKYAFLGALRSAAQMVSYEVSIGLIIVNIAFFSYHSLNLWYIVLAQQTVWFVFPFFFLFLLFFISSLAETNRAPFDLPEAEAELVAGYFVEYSSMTFALFFIGEYGSILLMSAFSVLLFLGGGSFLWYNSVLIFSIKVLFIYLLFIWVRAAFPRYRYDQLMRLGWKIFLPLSLGYVFLTSGLFLFFYQIIG